MQIAILHVKQLKRVGKAKVPGEEEDEEEEEEEEEGVEDEEGVDGREATTLRHTSQGTGSLASDMSTWPCVFGLLWDRLGR